MPPNGGTVVVSVACHDAWQRLQPWQQRPEKPLFLGDSLILASRERQPRKQDIVRIESQVHLLQTDETAHQQPRS